MFESQQQCQDWLVDVKSNALKGINIHRGSQSFESYVQFWLNDISQSRSESTVGAYFTTLSRVIPLIGRIALSDIQPFHIAALYDELSRTGSSPHAVKKIHKTLSSAFGYGIRMRFIPINPVSGISTTTHIPKERICYDKDQVEILLLGAIASIDRHFALYFTALQTAMRQGELLGLEWEDIDWEKKTIAVRRQLTSWSKGKVKFSPPKSEAGKRAITIEDDLISVLRKHYAKQMEKATKNSAWNPYSLVFPSSSGTPQNSSNLRRDYRKLLKFTGLPVISFHDLRHTSATLLLEDGIPISTVSKRLGHSKVSMTMDIYSHSTVGMEKEAALSIQSITSIKLQSVAHGLHTEAK